MPVPPPVAVVGVAGLFPGSRGIAGFWRDIVDGRDLCTDVPPTHWLIEDYHDPDPTVPDKIYTARGAFLAPIEIDPVEFGIPPTLFSSTDTSQLLALLVARDLLNDVTGNDLSRLKRDSVSVILGVTSGQKLYVEMANRLQRPMWVKGLRESGLPESEVQAICDRIAACYVPWTESSFPGSLGNVVAGRISNRFDLGGANCVTDAACASTLAATSMALSQLYLGQAEMVITGGADTFNDPSMYMCFSKTPALSAKGRCRPFDAEADGTLLGEGLGFVALKLLDAAERDGNRIYAVLRGLEGASDGRALSVYAPLAQGQARALRRCYDTAAIDPGTVELVEAHGTGTRAGDAAEFAGLTMAFGEAARTDRQWCALGSIKSQIGHTKAAAGAASMLKTIMALKEGVLPPTIGVDCPNPRLDFENSAFYLNTEARPWIRGSAYPRRAAVSAFGFGGSNWHMLLEEYRGPGLRAERLRASPTELVLLEAQDPQELIHQCRALASEATGVANLRWLARRCQLAWRGDAPARLALVAKSEQDLATQLERACATIAKAPHEAFAEPGGLTYAGRAQPGKLAYLFPGQGSQYPGMTADLAMGFAEALAVWDAADDGGAIGDAPLKDIVFPRPAFSDEVRAAQAARLRATEWTQPAMAVASLACRAILDRLGIRPDMVAGHSFGEISALAAAGALPDGEILSIAAERGALMGRAGGSGGGMLAAAISRREAEQLLAEWQLPMLVLANDNAPRQVVLSGSADSIAEAARRLGQAHVACTTLPVTVANHSPLIAEAVQPFCARLEAAAFASPRLPVYANSTAAPYPEDAAAARALLGGQMLSPVRFGESLEAMYEAGARIFLEVGPGGVLTGLAKQCFAGKPVTLVAMDRKGEHGLTSLWQALGQLAIAGVPIAFARLWDGVGVTAPPTKQPAMTITLTGANFGKPYPPPGGAGGRIPPNPERPAIAVAAAPASPAPPRAAELAGPMTPAPVTHAPAAKPEATRLLVEAHAAFQRTISDSHAQYLQMMESAFANYCAAQTGSGASLSGALSGAASWPIPAAPAAAMPEPAVPATFALPAAPLPPAPRIVACVPEPPAPVMPPPVPSDAGLTPSLLLAIVSEKTGYPASMLSMDMTLEADLGIDSIKRVEILSALQQRVPGLSSVDAAAMASLKTLGQIVAAMGGGAVAVAASTAPARDIAACLREIVAEKTGYPPEMLSLDMTLEADLGIDSIKRVEILSAVQQRLPDLPPLDAAALAGLKTLGQIVAAITGPAAAEGDAAGDHCGPARPKPGNGHAEPALPDVAMAVPLPLARFRIVERPAPDSGTRRRLVGPVIVTPDGNGISSELVAMLRDRGVAARESQEIAPDARGIVFLGGLRRFTGIADALAANHEAFRVAQAAAPAMLRGGLFVTVQDTGGNFGIDGQDALRAWSAGIAALARTAALEWPQATVKAVDLEQGGRAPKALAAILLAELESTAPEIDVGHRASGARVTVETVAFPLLPGDPVITKDSVLLVSGGARSITGAAIRQLARSVQPRLVLLGRTPLVEEAAAVRDATTDAEIKQALLATARSTGTMPTPAQLGAQAGAILAAREVRATLRALEESGSPTRYFAVDILDRAALDAALAEARASFGPITGLIHGAAVLADKRIAEKSLAQFETVFDTKVLGLQGLLEATRSDPLDTIVLFSSVASRTGNYGQCDYAMANEILNKVARAISRQRSHCHVRAIAWGPWAGGMVTPALEQHFRQRGVSIIAHDEGVLHFLGELSHCAPHESEVLVGGMLATVGQV